jgi:hypothetical protein
MSQSKRPCCRPASAHQWEPLPGDGNYVTCAKCGRLAGYQRGGRYSARGQIKLYNYPEIEQSIRERAAEILAKTEGK